MKEYQKIISLVLSVFVLASVLAVPVFAEDASMNDLKIVGADSVLMNYFHTGGNYVPYYIESLQDGDKVTWNTEVEKLVNPSSGAWTSLSLVPNPNAKTDTSADPYQKDALLCLNANALGVKFPSQIEPFVRIKATVTRGGVNKELSKEIMIVTHNQAIVNLRDGIYDMSGDTLSADTWENGTLLSEETADNKTEKYAHANASGATMQMSMYSLKTDDSIKLDEKAPKTNRYKLTKQALRGIYTVEATVRLRDDVSGMQTALAVKTDKDVETGTGEGNLALISMAVQKDDDTEQDTGYRKFCVNYRKVNGKVVYDVPFPDKKRTKDMFYKTPDEWQDIKLVMNQPEEKFDCYINGVQIGRNIPFYPVAPVNGETKRRPARLLAFTGVDVRQVNVYSGYPFERHMEFEPQKQVIYVDKDTSVTKELDVQTKMASYVYRDGSAEWNKKNDIVRNLYYPTEYPGVTVEPTYGDQSQETAIPASVKVTVGKNAATGYLPFRIDRGGELKTTYSDDYLRVRNYNFEGFENYTAGNAAPQEFNAYALIAEEAGTKYINFTRSDTGKLYIDRNPGAVYKLDLEIRDGDAATADNSFNTIQVKDFQKLTTNAMFVPETEFTAGTFYFDVAKGNYFGTIGRTSISGRMEDLMYLDFGAPLKSLHMKEIEAADMPVAADAKIEKNGKALNVSYDSTDTSVTYSQKWYQSADGVEYTEIAGQTDAVLEITGGLEGKHIKAGVTAVKGGWTYEYFTQAVLVEAPSAGGVEWSYDANEQKLTASITLDSTEFHPATMMVAVYDKSNKNIFLESVEATKTDNGDGTVTLSATVDYNTADTLTVKAFVWDSMDSMRPILKQAAVYTPPVTQG